ncbi:hypothetical protein [Faucicola boevrei]|uniref:hypothetical protein n=1 Tax=Faucicola boevrei TaxID=346665 RepID=UPI00036A56FC|nr:hypothetical protein [Moraxella boevrei]
MVTILRLAIGVALLTATHLGMAQAWQTNNRTISITTGLMQQDYQEYDNHQRVDNGILNTEKSDIHEFAINTRYQHTHQGLWLQGRATHVTGATNYDGFLQQGNQLIPYQSITDNTMYKLSANVGYALPVGEKIQLIPNIGGQHQRWDRQLSQYDERFTQRSVSAGIVAQYQATPNIGLEVSVDVGKQIISDIKVP